MNAIVFVRDASGESGGVVECLPLFPLLDRPFLQHVVEFLIERGAKHVRFVVGRHACSIEQYFGTGVQWGCPFEYFLTPDSDRPVVALRTILGDGDGTPAVIGFADELPPLPPRLDAVCPGTYFTHAGHWTGWAVVDAETFHGVPASASGDDLGTYLASEGKGCDLGTPVRLRSTDDIGAAQRLLLGGGFPGLLCAAREVRPGVWLAPRVTVDSSAELVPPLFIGENSFVGSGARVGPNAVVGYSCLLDRDCGLRETTVLPTSYVGPDVQLDGVIVDHFLLLNPDRRTATIVEDHLLSGLEVSPPIASGVGRVVERVLALLVFVASLPVLILVAAWLWATRSGPILFRRSFVRTPASVRSPVWHMGYAYSFTPPRQKEAETGWLIPPRMSGLVLEMLPAMEAVARGHLRVVGLPPRSPELLRRFPTARRVAMLRMKAGLVTEAAMFCGPDAEPDDVLLADVFQAHMSTRGSNVARFIRFLSRSVGFTRQTWPGLMTNPVAGGQRMIPVRPMPSSV